MGIINYIEFGGVKSSDYGIYVSGEGTFNAPERDVELIEIPGRNGDLSLDKGRFKNITVTYPVFNYETNLADFRTRLSDFRNALKSKIGYQRLEDTFHPDEYRMATFVDMIDVKPVMYNTASTIELTFNCKPQRFLKSGEIPQTIGEWGETQTVEGEVATFNAEPNTAIKSLVVDINPVQSGSGDPSPDNVRPISGWEEVQTYVCGVNAWDEEWELGALGGSGGNATSSTEIRSKNYIPVVGGQTYYLYCAVASTFNYRFYDADKNFISGSYISRNNTLTIPNDARYMRFYMGAAYGTTYNNDISINYPSTDTDYHAYIGTTYTTDLPETVYGGSLDVVNGVLTVDRAMEIFNGSSVTSVSSSSGVQFARVVASNPSTGMTSGMISNAYTPSTLSANGNIVWVSASQRVVRIFDDRFTDSETATAIMNETPVQLCYELATPTPIYCEPTEIKSLKGNNNIWADSGEVSVEYGADPNDAYNPTLFESQPLLNANGYGNIDINGQNILISGEPIGEIDLVNSGTLPYSDVILTMAEGNAARLNEGDVITVAATKATKRVDIRDEYLSTFRYDSVNVRGDAVSDVTGGASLLSDGAGYTYYMDIPAQTFNYGTPITQHSYYLYLSITYTLNGTQTTFYSGCRFSVEYDGARTIRYKLWPESSLNARIVQSYYISVGKTTAVSTKLLGDNVYIDLELGEAYKIDGDLVISANSSVTLPAILPVLNTGDNSITFDDTITSLKITPRWWKI